MKAYERLLSYVKVFTPSDENGTPNPSSAYQFDLAELLVKELKELDLGNLTPIEALNTLYQLQNKLKNRW